MRPTIHIKANGEDQSPTVTEQLIEVQQARLHASQALLKRFKTKEPMIQFNEGDLVWLDRHNLTIKVPSRKLAAKRYGPFMIIKQISPVAYQLQLPEYMKVHNVFHINLLFPYKEMEQYGPSFPHPPPDLIDGQEEQEIEAILDVCRKGKQQGLQYLIKWKGFPSSENEWVNKEEMHVDDLVKQFHTS